jgi:hypothetical protein
VPATASFTDILDEKLGAFRPDRTPPPSSRGYATAVASGFFFLYSGAQVAAAPRATAPGLWTVEPLAMSSAPVETSRVQRTLSTKQQRAFDQLVALGARLTPDFTIDELRSAFRLLARRYHPDSHPKSSAADKSRLSFQFTQLHAAYSQLRTLA